MSETVPERVARLETLAENTLGTLQRIERRIEDVHGEVVRLDTKLDAVRSESRSDMQAMRSELHGDAIRLDGKLDAFRTQAHGDLWRILGAGAGALVASLVAMAWMLQHLR